MARHSNILAACWKWLAGIICQMRTCLATQHWIIQLCLFLQCVQWSQCSANEGRNSQPDRSKIIRQRLTRDALLPCKLLRGRDLGQVQWWYRAVGKQLIGTFDANSRSSNVTWSRDGAYQILENGTLFVKNVRRELVERYECAANSSSEGRELRDNVYLRLDFSFWYAPEPFSMFFGSCLAALVFCAASFVLNIVWIFVRWVVLRCIKRAERLSRVRSMLEAMEKYRHRQMESIHEGYSRRMSAIRDNYHYQMEMLRQSYADSADRFRDYRQAQMDNVQQHLDNYYQQISRLREFGSRHVEQLWESYDRSLTAVRTFTLEQRLKILNQYKVKQRYVNKLLEAIATETNVDLISRKEAAIRDVLGEEELPPPVWPPPLQSSNVTAPMAGVCGKVPIPRSASYYSLPEFMVEEEEGLVEQQQRQQPITAAAEEVELCQQPSTSGSSQSTRDTRVHLEC